jgi:hypothetical protein
MVLTMIKKIMDLYILPNLASIATISINGCFEAIWNLDMLALVINFLNEVKYPCILLLGCLK